MRQAVGHEGLERPLAQVPGRRAARQALFRRLLMRGDRLLGGGLDRLDLGVHRAAQAISVSMSA
jgi:hypothetical protein